MVSSLLLVVMVLVMGMLLVPAESAEAAVGGSVSFSVSPSSLPAVGGPVAVTTRFAPGASCSITTSTSDAGLRGWCNGRSGVASTLSGWVRANSTGSPMTVVFTLQATILGRTYVKTASVQVGALASTTYVALGDSYASGEGIKLTGYVDTAGVVSATQATKDGCNRSSQSYPIIMSSWLASQPGMPPFQLADLACSGATSTDISSSSPATGLGLAGASGDHGETTQLDNATVLSRAKVVTIMVGGDDANFRAIAEACATAVVVDQCSPRSPISSVAQAAQNIGQLGSVLSSTYAAVRSAAPQARLYVVDYPDMVPESVSATQYPHGCGGIPKGYAISYLSQLEPLLHAQVRSAAAAAGAVYVDPNSPSAPQSFQGHSLCESKSKQWFFGLGKTGPFHPNVTGQSNLAADLEAQIVLVDQPSAFEPLGTDSTFTGNDDLSLSVNLPFVITLGGTNYSTAYFNNNGTLTFRSPTGQFTPVAMSQVDQPMIAAFWADVDTRGGRGAVTYGSGQVRGQTAIAFNWTSVGCFATAGGGSNSFQIVLIARADRGPGAFDVEFNYGSLQWDSGQATAETP